MKIPFKLPHKIEDRNRVMGILIGIGLAFIFSALYAAGPLRSFGNFDLDLKFRLRQSLSKKSAFKHLKLPANKDIIFLDIDDETLAWEDTYPDDPLYYTDIIKALGSGKNAALGLVFTFDYTRQFPRNVDKVFIDQGESFKMELETYAGYVGSAVDYRQDLLQRLSGIKEMITTPGAATSTVAIAEEVNNEVFSGALQSSFDQSNPSVLDNLMQAGAFAASKDLNAIAPERELTLEDPIKKSGNIFFVYLASSYIPTPYKIDELKKGTGLELLIKVLDRPTTNRPENPRLGRVYDAYQNLSPEELDSLLKVGNLPRQVRDRIIDDRDTRREEFDEFSRQNGKLAIKLTSGATDVFIKITRVKPVFPGIGLHTAGQGVGRAEFTKDDGTVRKIAPLFELRGKLYPHIDMLMAMRYLGVNKDNVIVRRDKIILKGARDPKTKKKTDMVIPLQNDGTMLINWAGVWADTTTFKHKNFRDLWIAIYSVRLFDAYKKFQSLPEEEQGAFLANFFEGEQIVIYKYLVAEEYDNRVKTEFPQYAAAPQEEIDEYMAGLNGYAQTAFSFYMKHRELMSIPAKERDKYLQSLPEEERNVVELAGQLAQGELTVPEKKINDMRKDITSLRGKILLVGRTAEGTEEINPIPLEPRYRFLGVHANAINTIITGEFIHEPGMGYVFGIFFLLALSLGFIGGLVHHKSSVVIALINFCIMIVVAFIYFSIATYTFGAKNLDVPLLIPIALIIISFLLVFLYRFITEEHEKNKMKGMFSTYVNKEVVESLIEDPDKLKLGGEWVTATVFFSDVAGFTTISESLKPEELVDLLNEYLTAMTDIVFQYGGTLDKYIGDAIVAVYGAPIHFPEHAVNACFGALDMQKKLVEMRKVWKEQGKHELLARCGVNTGDMISGNMGSTTRFNYTVMGANVEMGEHMESSGKTYGTFITITEETKKQAGDKIITRQVDILAEHGFPKPFGVYELLAKAEDGISEDMKKGVALFEEALMLYFGRKWDEAIAKFNEVYKYIPDDSPTKKALERCEKARANPPGPEFDELLASRA